MDDELNDVQSGDCWIDGEECWCTGLWIPGSHWRAPEDDQKKNQYQVLVF